MNSKPTSHCFLSSSRGATFLEFALVAVLFVGFILAIIEFSRYLAVRAVLIKGAQDGLTLAKTLYGVDLDIRDASESDDVYKDFIEARERVIGLQDGTFGAALRLPLNTLATGSSYASSNRLYSFSIQDTLKTTNPEHNFDAVLLRPGESAKINFPDGRVVWRDHPNVCSQASPTCTNPISATADYSQLMHDNPMVVELRADVSTLFGTFSATGRAVGFRERSDSTSAPANTLPLPGETRVYRCSNLPDAQARRNACERGGGQWQGWVTSYNLNNCCTSNSGVCTDTQATCAAKGLYWQGGATAYCCVAGCQETQSSCQAQGRIWYGGSSPSCCGNLIAS